jgi:hypothetical protein
MSVNENLPAAAPASEELACEVYRDTSVVPTTANNTNAVVIPTAPTQQPSEQPTAGPSQPQAKKKAAKRQYNWRKPCPLSRKFPRFRALPCRADVNQLDYKAARREFKRLWEAHCHDENFVSTRQALKNYHRMIPYLRRALAVVHKEKLHRRNNIIAKTRTFLQEAAFTLQIATAAPYVPCEECEIRKKATKANGEGELSTDSDSDIEMLSYASEDPSSSDTE